MPLVYIMPCSSARYSHAYTLNEIMGIAGLTSMSESERDDLPFASANFSPDDPVKIAGEPVSRCRRPAHSSLSDVRSSFYKGIRTTEGQVRALSRSLSLSLLRRAVTLRINRGDDRVRASASCISLEKVAVCQRYFPGDGFVICVFFISTLEIADRNSPRIEAQNHWFFH